MCAERRKPIPKATADQVLFESNRTCCICREHGKPLHIHHADGNPANNRLENLVALCLDHHHEATARSSIGRQLSPGLIVRYRDAWLQIVSRRRSAQLERPPAATGTHDALLQALACHEIRKSSYGASTDNWEATDAALHVTFNYVADWLHGDLVCQEAMSFAYGVAGRTRMGMPTATASLVRDVASAALPVVSLVHPAQVVLDKTRSDIFLTGIGVGHALAYDATQYPESLAILDSGCRILWSVLRFAQLNELLEVKQRCLEDFGAVEKTARGKGNVEALEWIEFMRADALALPGDTPPDLPREVERLIYDLAE